MEIVLQNIIYFGTTTLQIESSEQQGKDVADQCCPCIIFFYYCLRMKSEACSETSSTKIVNITALFCSQFTTHNYFKNNPDETLLAVPKVQAAGVLRTPNINVIFPPCLWPYSESLDVCNVVYLLRLWPS